MRPSRFVLPVLCVAALVSPASDEDPRTRLHAATEGYLQALRTTRSTHLSEGRAVVERQGEYLLAVLAYTHASEAGSGGMAFREMLGYMLQNTIGLPSTGIGLQLRAFTQRTPDFDSEEAWTEDLGNGRYRQKWLLTEEVMEPENIEELFLQKRSPWVMRVKQHALQFVLADTPDGAVIEEPNLTTMRDDDIPNEIHRHFGLLGPGVLDIVWPRSFRDAARVKER